jgi:hypothetical protein
MKGEEEIKGEAAVEVGVGIEIKAEVEVEIDRGRDRDQLHIVEIIKGGDTTTAITATIIAVKADQDHLQSNLMKEGEVVEEDSL